MSSIAETSERPQERFLVLAAGQQFLVRGALEVVRQFIENLLSQRRWLTITRRRETGGQFVAVHGQTPSMPSTEFTPAAKADHSSRFEVSACLPLAVKR